jgi:hypothetical protein
MSDHDPLCPIFGVDDEAIAEDSTILYDCACALIARVRATVAEQIAQAIKAEAAYRQPPHAYTHAAGIAERFARRFKEEK